jgi:hypothetical protein
MLLGDHHTIDFTRTIDKVGVDERNHVDGDEKASA